MQCSGTCPLLASVPADTATQYYQALIGHLGHHVEIRLDAGGGRGKGMFATKDFKKGDILLTERPLAAVQQLESKLEVSTCSHCFKAVGTVEQHVGGKICCIINELSEATEEEDLREVQHRVDKIQAAVNSRFLEGLLQGHVSLPLTDKVDMAEPVKCRAGCGEEYCSAACEEAAWERSHCLLCSVGVDTATTSSTSSSADDKGKGPAPSQQQQQQSSGSSSRHHSSSSSSKKLKPVIHEVHGVRVNRSKLASFYEHADETNDIFRVAAQVIASTIVTADKLLQQQAEDAADDAEARAAYDRAMSAASAGARIAARVVMPDDDKAAEEGSSSATEIRNEQQVAADAFTRAADAAVGGSSQQSVVVAAAAGGDAAADRTEQQVAAAAYARAADAAAAGNSGQNVVVAANHAPSSTTADTQQQQCSKRQQHLAAVQAAFLPFALGHKVPWWDIVAEQEAAAAGSDDFDSDDVSPAELAAQMHELATESLELLKAGLQDDRFPELFDLQLYGSLVGMFELNNLALAVPAPVGRYKDMLLHPEEAGVDAQEAAAALQEVMPLLDALGEAADTPTEGTGFYVLQSCINHSCAPNAAASCLPNGQMVIRALQDIPAGSEIQLSYIEQDGANLQERREMLRDYGFVCSCQRCAAEELAGQLAQQQLVGV